MRIKKILRLLDFYRKYEKRVREAHDPYTEDLSKKLTIEEVSEFKERWSRLRYIKNNIGDISKEEIMGRYK
jgi:hypothetical protein